MKERLKIWKKQLEVLKSPIRHCRICFEEINDRSLYNIINPKSIICDKCAFSLKATFKTFKIGLIRATAIYDYDETIKKLIYQFKGCYDYELKDVFLDRYKSYLHNLYKGYIVVPVPSNEIDDLKRGFNHVVEIYKSLSLPMIHCIKKTSKEKQSSKNSKERLKTDKSFVGENLENIYGKKVLLVDDIYTTGSTINKCLEIVKSAKPKRIQVLLIAKTIDLDKRKQNYNIP